MNENAIEIAALEARLAVLKSAPRVVDVSSIPRTEPSYDNATLPLRVYGTYNDENGGTRSLGAETIRQSDVAHTDALYDILQAMADPNKNTDERLFELIPTVHEGKQAYLIVSNTASQLPSRG